MKTQKWYVLMIMKIFSCLFFTGLVGCNEQTLHNNNDINLGSRRPATANEAIKLQKQTAAELGVPFEKSIDLGGGVKMEFVLIPAGEFYMGSPKSEKGRDGDEGPVHYVKISKPFYMGKYEVTQLQYRVVVGPGKAFYFRGNNYPADKVSWNQANKFCGELFEHAGLLARLPTEAEWEYACRAGTTTPFYTGATINPDQANYNGKKTYPNGVKGTYLRSTVEVGSYPPNPFGLYDMHGNVWEWCNDRYLDHYYKISLSIDPHGSGDSLSTVIRGGAWDCHPTDCRSANRDDRKSWRHIRDTGFRAVLELE